MAVVRIPEAGRVFREDAAVTAALAAIGIDYARVEVPAEVVSAPADRVLATYDRETSVLKQKGGYVTADVIDVKPSTPNLDAMLAKFSREHWHDEDEVRLIVSGNGVFHIHPKDGGPVHAIEVGPGDSIRVPAGTHHWFDLCATRQIRAIRLFQDPSGWTPHYTESGAEKGFQPVCLGPAYIPA
jgi:1,2-dihydroxy-3-keto-5-methylthiopentene dioxygenase